MVAGSSVGVSVGVGVSDGVGVSVSVGVMVAVGVSVEVKVMLGVNVKVGVEVDVYVAVNVEVSVGGGDVGVCVGGMGVSVAQPVSRKIVKIVIRSSFLTCYLPEYCPLQRDLNH